MGIKCRDCIFMEDYGTNNLYICKNPHSDNYGEFTGICCEDDCEDGEDGIKAESEAKE